MLLRPLPKPVNSTESSSSSESDAARSAPFWNACSRRAKHDVSLLRHSIYNRTPYDVLSCAGICCPVLPQHLSQLACPVPGHALSRPAGGATAPPRTCPQRSAVGCWVPFCVKPSPPGVLYLGQSRCGLRHDQPCSQGCQGPLTALAHRPQEQQTAQKPPTFEE